MIRVDEYKCECNIMELAIKVPIHNHFFKTAFGMIVASLHLTKDKICNNSGY